jgi:DNA-binding response OmpR family regulator
LPRADSLSPVLIEVLSIEDDIDFVDLVRVWLARESPSIQFKLNCVTTLSDALSYLGKFRVDLAIVDLGLPDSRGLATLENVATVAGEIPIVVLSAEDDDIVCDALNCGAVDHIAKAHCNGNTLVVAILNALARHFENRKSAKCFPRALGNALNDVRRSVPEE